MEIEIITKEDVLRGVPSNWAEQYKDVYWKGTDKEAITKRLNSLPTAELTVENIGRIIGNDSWTRNECQFCQQHNDKIALITIDDFNSVYICEDCTKSVLRMFRKKG